MSLRLDAVTVGVGDTVVLRELTTEVPAGQLLVVTGPPTSGKSLLLATIAGLRRPLAGRVTFDGRAVDEPAVLRRCGYAPQSIQVLDPLTAVENVALPLLAREGPPAQAWRRADEILDELEIPATNRHNLAEQLSGGQRQRVAFARAVVHDPELIVADDPTSELDPATAQRVLAMLRRRAAAGAVVVLATTDPQLAGSGDARLELSARPVEAD
jgi:putative ABC transport system ATP-binding protein